MKSGELVFVTASAVSRFPSSIAPPPADKD
jgi:hypothetical protein